MDTVYLVCYRKASDEGEGHFVQVLSSMKEAVDAILALGALDCYAVELYRAQPVTA